MGVRIDRSMEIRLTRKARVGKYASLVSQLECLQLGFDYGVPVRCDTKGEARNLWQHLYKLNKKEGYTIRFGIRTIDGGLYVFRSK